MTVWKYEKTHVILVRTVCLIALLVLISCVLIGRLFYLQILQGAHFYAMAEKNRTAVCYDYAL